MTVRRRRQRSAPSCGASGSSWPGFTVVFVALGATASSIGRLLKAHEIALAHVSGAVIVLLGIVMVLAALPSRVWAHAGGGTLGVVSRVTGERRFDVRPSRLGAWAAPLMGMAFAFAWTPCIGPVLGVVLGLAANNGTLPGGVLLLFAYSLGLAVPFVLVGLAFGRLTAALNHAAPLALGGRARRRGDPDRVRRPAAHGQRQLGVDAALEPPEPRGPRPALHELSDGGLRVRPDPPRRSGRRAVRAHRRTARGADRPVLVALDGRSGAGKSTLARAVGALVGALVIDGDDFYRGGPDAYLGRPGPRAEGRSGHRLGAPALPARATGPW